MKVPLSKIHDNPFNTRQEYGDLSGLVSSIKKYGLTYKLPVRKTTRGYELIFGSRRLRALQTIGVQEIEVEERAVNDSDMVILAICENSHRKDLNPIELARAYNVGLKVTGLNIKEFAKIVGASEGTIYSYLRILELPDRILHGDNHYNTNELVNLSRIKKISNHLGTEFEQFLDQKQVPYIFLNEIAQAVEKIFHSSLPEKKKVGLGMQVIWEDYSGMGKNQYKYIPEFANNILTKALVQYHERLRKTKRGKEILKDNTNLSVKGVIKPDVRLERIISFLTTFDRKLDKVLSRGDYSEASEDVRRRFNKWARKLYNRLEQILNQDEI